MNNSTGNQIDDREVGFVRKVHTSNDISKRCYIIICMIRQIDHTRHQMIHMRSVIDTYGVLKSTYKYFDNIIRQLMIVRCILVFKLVSLFDMLDYVSVEEFMVSAKTLNGQKLIGQKTHNN